MAAFWQENDISVPVKSSFRFLSVSEPEEEEEPSVMGTSSQSHLLRCETKTTTTQMPGSLSP
jgi:hypothetical protein